MGEIDLRKTEVDRGRADALQSVIAIGETAPLEDDEVHHLSECDGHEREVDAVEAHDERPDDERGDRRDRDAEDHRESETLHLRKELEDGDARAVRAEAEERRMAVRELSRVAEQQIETDRRDSDDEDLCRQTPVAVEDR